VPKLVLGGSANGYIERGETFFFLLTPVRGREYPFPLKEGFDSEFIGKHGGAAYKNKSLLL